MQLQSLPEELIQLILLIGIRLNYGMYNAFLVCKHWNKILINVFDIQLTLSVAIEDYYNNRGLLYKELYPRISVELLDTVLYRCESNYICELIRRRCISSVDGWKYIVTNYAIIRSDIVMLETALDYGFLLYKSLLNGLQETFMFKHIDKINFLMNKYENQIVYC
jgi:hypothetical protein